MAKAVNRYWQKVEACWGTWVQTFNATSILHYGKSQQLLSGSIHRFWIPLLLEEFRMEVTTAWITGTTCPSTRKWRSFLVSWKRESIFLGIATNLIMSNEESAITLMNKGYISFRKGGDNVLASSSKCFSFQPDTLQSCLSLPWAACASSTHFPVGILEWHKWWWLHCSTGGVQEDKEDN